MLFYTYCRTLQVTEDYHEIFFNFTSNFEILNDMEILKKMGMHKPEAPVEDTLVDAPAVAGGAPVSAPIEQAALPSAQ